MAMQKNMKVLAQIAGIILILLLGAVLYSLEEKKSDRSIPGTDSEYGVLNEDQIFALDTAGAATTKASMAESLMVVDDGANMIAPVPQEPRADTSDVPQDERLIIKTGFFSVVVENVDAAIDSFAAYVVSQGGFIVSQHTDEYGSVPSGSITVRIPSETFDSGVGQVGILGQVKSERVNGQDVTEEFVDLGSRLKSLRASETQFLGIMKQAKDIEDVLAVQRELTNVRVQIESIEGRRKYLSESAKLSTIAVNFSTDSSALPVLEDDKWKPIRTIKEAARDVVDAFQILGDGIIWVIVYIPVAMVYSLLAWFMYWVGRKVYMRIKK